VAAIKKFQFPLETVLDYKQQVQDSLKIEHGAILAQVRRQEDVIAGIAAKFEEVGAEFAAKKSAGITVAEALSYDIGLRALENQRKREQNRLKILQRQEAEKRAQLVNSRIETSSLELLREKKFERYQQDLLKEEERFIDDLVGSSWGNREMAGL
jgi:flagellar FliJ protein